MTPPMMKFSFIFVLLSAGIGLNMDGVVVISTLIFVKALFQVGEWGKATAWVSEHFSVPG